MILFNTTNLKLPHLRLVKTILPAELSKVKTCYDLTVRASKLKTFSVSIAYSFSLVLRKTFAEVRVLLTGKMPMSSSAFLNHIRDVILWRPKEQMVRTYTERGITSMQDVKTWVKWSVLKFIRYTMGIDLSPAPTTRTYSPVITGDGTSPQPTGISLVDLRPESVGYWDRFRASLHATIIPNVLIELKERL